MAFTIKTINQIKLNNWLLVELEFDPKKSSEKDRRHGKAYFAEAYLDLVEWLKENVGTEYLIQYEHRILEGGNQIVKVALNEVNATALRLAI